MKTRSILRVGALLCALVSATAWADEPRDQPKNSASADAARADISKTLGFVPGFLNAVPDSALPGAWQEMKTLQMNPKTVLPPKIKELVGLAVAAQVPCQYCTYAHTKFAELNGANKQEIGEAVMLAALARHWSTFMNGMQLDEAKFRAEISAVVERMKKSAPPANMPPAAASDGKAAIAQVQATYGLVPEFMKRFPDASVAGAWTEMRDLEVSETAIPSKYKSLIGLAVSAQIPCKFCTIADTEFAKLGGASEAEIAETVAMAAITRHWSTVLNGMQTDESAFRRDVDRLVKNSKAAMKAAAALARREEQGTASGHAQGAPQGTTATQTAQHAMPAQPIMRPGEMPKPRADKDRKVSVSQ